MSKISQHYIEQQTAKPSIAPRGLTVSVSELLSMLDRSVAKRGVLDQQSADLRLKVENALPDWDKKVMTTASARDIVKHRRIRM